MQPLRKTSDELWLATSGHRATKPTYDVLGMPITATNPVDAFGQILSWAEDDVGRYVGLRDVASTVALQSTPELQEVGRQAAMNLPDGMPLALLGRLRGHNVRRTCGTDLMDLTLREGRAYGLRHFLMGGKPGTAEKIIKRYSLLAPGVDFVGSYCPPMRPLTEVEQTALVAKIRASGADIVWVGISSPKQDIWMYETAERLSQTLIGVGAAFDFLTGQVRRAPKWMQRSGLEWLHRLYSEPKRLWRRYLVLAPLFVIKVAFAKRQK